MKWSSGTGGPWRSTQQHTGQPTWRENVPLTAGAYDFFSLVAEQHGFCPGRRRKAPWRRALWHHDAMARHGAIAPGRHGGPRRPRAAALGTDVQEWAFNLVAKQHGRLFRSKLELTARWRTTIGQGEPAHTPCTLTGGSRNDHVVKSTPLARTGGCRNDHVVKSTSLT